MILSLNKVFERLLKIKNLEFYVLAIILLFGLVVRLYKINNPLADWHSFRQADTASVSRTYLEEGINLLIPRYHDISRVQSGIFNPNGYRFVEFPIYNAIHAITYKLVPIFSFEATGRLISIICALITAIFMYLIGSKIYIKRIGVLFALFYLFIPYNIYFTRVILPEPMAVMFAVVSCYLFINYSENKKSISLLLSALMLSLGVLIKPYVIVYGLVTLIYFYREVGYKKLYKNKDLIIFSLIILVPFILWRFWMAKFPAGIPFWKWTFNGDGIRFKPAFWRWIFGERLGNLILGVWGMVPFIFGILNLKKKDWFVLSLLAGSFLYVAVFATANVRHDYYQSIIIPPVAMVLGLGSYYLWQNKISNLKLQRTILIFSLAMMFIFALTQVREYYNINKPEIIAAGAAINRLVPKNSLIIAAYNGDTAFLYQTKRKGWPVVELPINELIDEGAEYYTTVNLNDPQAQEFMRKFKVIEKTDQYVIIKLQ